MHSVTVPGRYQYLKWWKLALVLLGVWIAAAEAGLSLFYWWYHTVDKTAAAFMVLVYVVACVVAGVMLAMVQGRPLISALSIAVMSGPFASVAAAAPLYGYYYCARVLPAWSVSFRTDAAGHRSRCRDPRRCSVRGRSPLVWARDFSL